MRTRESCGVCNFSAVQGKGGDAENTSAAEAGEAGTLECHRWPPVPAGMVEGAREGTGGDGSRSALTGVWPAVVAGAWCGEFAHKRQDYGEPGLRHYS